MEQNLLEAKRIEKKYEEFLFPQKKKKKKKGKSKKGVKSYIGQRLRNDE